MQYEQQCKLRKCFIATCVLRNNVHVETMIYVSSSICNSFCIAHHVRACKRQFLTACLFSKYNSLTNLANQNQQLLPTTDGCKTYKVDLKICVETDMRNETSHVAEILIHLFCV